ncbi:MAG: dihydrolipoamide acetyltransferase family protein [Bacteroidota bacterium]
MSVVQMVMPKMGESIMEGTVLTWLKKAGDRIEQDEAVLEVATDKVDTEVPATHAGILQEILVQEGDVVPVGSVIALIATGDTVPATANGTPVNSSAANSAAVNGSAGAAHIANGAAAAPVKGLANGVVTAVPASAAISSVKTLDAPIAGRFYSPLVMNMAREENISMAELERIPGTGKDSRVSKRDMLEYITGKKQHGEFALGDAVSAQSSQAATATQTQAKPAAAPAQSTNPAPAVSYSGAHEIIEMDRMRKMIAQRMLDSKRISPHVTSFVEADVTNLTIWRGKIQSEFRARENDSLTYTPLFIDAVARALRDYPMMNVSVDGDRIIVKKNINIGMAVALPSGNLIVPVIKNADQYNLTGLSRKVNDLARRARENKLTPDDLSDGTYTLSNVGSFGNVMGTPIIMQPQVGILAVGAIRKKPAVIETPQGDTIGIRSFMFLSHSYDHRVVDGALGGMFVRRVADYLEGWDLNRKL